MKVKFFGVFVCMLLAALVGCGSDSDGRAAGDCGDILRCFLACEDDTCAKACDDGYPAAVASAWKEDVRWCVDDDESCDYELSCLQDVCAAELEACSEASSSDQ